MNQPPKRNLFIVIGEYWAERQAERPATASRSSWLPTPGNILFTLLIAGLLILTQRAWANNGPTSVNAPGPSATTVNYQGRLADSNGNPINDNRTIQFAIYDAASGGNVVWGAETHANVPVTDGLFNVGLGSLTSGGIPTTVWNGDRYLQITVNGEVLSPRELIRSVPIAGMALTAETANNALSANTAQTVPDGVVTSRKTKLTMSRVNASTILDLTTTTATLVPGSRTTLSLPVPSKVLVIASCDAESRTTDTLVICELWVNNTLQPSAIQAGRATNTQGSVSRITAGNSYVLELGAGSHTIEMRAKLWRAGDGQNGRVYSTHTGYSYLVTSQ